MDTLHIYRLSDEEPVRLAAAELRKVLSRATGAEVRVGARAQYEEDASGLWVGAFAAFSDRIVQRSSGHPFDDEVRGRLTKCSAPMPRSLARSRLPRLAPC